jgi:hypothetical protein
MLSQVSTLFLISVLSVSATTIRTTLASRGAKCDITGFSCPSVDLRSHTSSDCSDTPHWWDVTKRFLFTLDLNQADIHGPGGAYKPGKCRGNYGGSATLTGIDAVAFQIVNVQDLPDGKQCFVQVFGDDSCSDEPNWVGPLSEDSVGGCFGAADPHTGVVRNANSFQLVCCDSLEVNCV